MDAVQFPGIGTRWQVDTSVPLTGLVLHRILDTVERFDATWSRFREDSVVSRMREAVDGGTFSFPEEGAAIFDLYDQLHDASGGAVDPFVGADLEALGYDAAYSLSPIEPLPEPAGVDRWRSWADRDGGTLTTDRAVTLDVGAVGKGLLVDIISEMLTAEGQTDFVVDGSGDMRHRGTQTLRVGLEHPLHADRVIGVAEVQDAAICASATNRRRWAAGLHHVVDARTGRPTDDVIATWAVAPTAAQADGWSTALFFTEPDSVVEPEQDSVEWVRVLASGEVRSSPGFVGELFT